MPTVVKESENRDRRTVRGRRPLHTLQKDPLFYPKRTANHTQQSQNKGRTTCPRLDQVLTLMTMAFVFMLSMVLILMTDTVTMTATVVMTANCDDGEDDNNGRDQSKEAG